MLLAASIGQAPVSRLTHCAVAQAPTRAATQRGAPLQCWAPSQRPQRTVRQRWRCVRAICRPAAARWCAAHCGCPVGDRGAGSCRHAAAVRIGNSSPFVPQHKQTPRAAHHPAAGLGSTALFSPGKTPAACWASGLQVGRWVTPAAGVQGSGFVAQGPQKHCRRLQLPAPLGSSPVVHQPGRPPGPASRRNALDRENEARTDCSKPPAAAQAACLPRVPSAGACRYVGDTAPLSAVSVKGCREGCSVHDRGGWNRFAEVVAARVLRS